MIRYYSDLSRAFTDELLAKPDKIHGWRLVEVTEDQEGCEYYLTRWLVEDELAGTMFAGMFAGKRVNVTFRHYDDGKISISQRHVLNA